MPAGSQQIRLISRRRRATGSDAEVVNNWRLIPSADTEYLT